MTVAVESVSRTLKVERKVSFRFDDQWGEKLFLPGTRSHARRDEPRDEMRVRWNKVFDRETIHAVKRDETQERREGRKERAPIVAVLIT